MENNRKRGDEIYPSELIDGDRFCYPGKTNKVWTAEWKGRLLCRYHANSAPKYPEKYPANKFMQKVVWLRNIYFKV